MSRTVASLPAGSRITDYISLGVVAKTFPLEKIRALLAATGKERCVSATCRHTGRQKSAEGVLVAKAMKARTVPARG